MAYGMPTPIEHSDAPRKECPWCKAKRLKAEAKQKEASK